MRRHPRIPPPRHWRPPRTSPPTASTLPPLHLCRPIKGGARSPLHPAPLLLPAPQVQHRRRWSTARPSELRVDLFFRPSFLPSKASGEFLKPSFSFLCFSCANWWSGGRPWLFSGELHRRCRRAPLRAGRSPAGLARKRLGPSDGHGWSRLKGALYPFGGPLWTGGPGPRARSTAGVSSYAMLASCLRQPANRDSPRGATKAHLPAALATLQISPPFLEFTNIPLPPI
jgi:hypothetical protein